MVFLLISNIKYICVNAVEIETIHLFHFIIHLVKSSARREKNHRREK